MGRVSQSVTIAAGASLSDAIPIDRFCLVGLILPPRWTPAGVAFMALADSPAHPTGTFLPVVDQAAAAVNISDPTTAGTNQVQTITETGTPAGGTFKLSFGGQQTSALAYNISAAALKTALGALSTIGGTANIDTAGGTLESAPITVTFKGALMEQTNALLTLSDNSLTGGTAPSVGIAETTAAVASTVRYVVLDLAAKWLSGFAAIKLRSGTNASPVAQTEARVIRVIALADDN